MSGGVSESAVSDSGFGSYIRLLRSPGAATLASWGVVGRLPIAMRSIGCLLLVSAVTGSLAGAGAVSAAMLVAQGVASPVLGRFADRVGQRRVLIIACAGHAAGMILLVSAVELRAPLWLMVLAAVATGCFSVSFMSFMRARWATLVDQGDLRTAYALESMLDETIFLIGPLLVTTLVTAVHPTAGLLACAVLTTIGSIAVARHHRSEPYDRSGSPQSPPHAPGTAQPRPGRAIAIPGVRILMVIYGAMGFLLGAVDVTMIAFARKQSAPGLTGVFLSLTAVGSFTAGAVYGSRNWKWPQARLLSLCAGLLTLGVIPLAFAPSSPVMALLAILAGVAISPGVIAGSTMLESLTPKSSLSEGFSWLTSAGATGIAAGTAVGGRVAGADVFSHAAWAAVGGGAVALVLSVAGQPILRDATPGPSPGPQPTVLEEAALEQ